MLANFSNISEIPGDNEVYFSALCREDVVLYEYIRLISLFLLITKINMSSMHMQFRLLISISCSFSKICEKLKFSKFLLISSYI